MEVILVVNWRNTDTSELSQEIDDLIVINTKSDLCYRSKESITLQSERKKSFHNHTKFQLNCQSCNVSSILILIHSFLKIDIQ